MPLHGNVWHCMKGLTDEAGIFLVLVSSPEIIEIVRTLTGYRRKLGTVTKNMIRFLGFFYRFMREYEEMYYLNEEPVVL